MPENDMSRKIKELRAKYNLTLEDIAQQVGVGRSTVRKWETGQIQNMRRDKIAKLAYALHTTPEYLMGWDNNEIENSPIKSSKREATDEEIQFALFGGNDEITEKMYDEVKSFAAYLKQREGYNK